MEALKLNNVHITYKTIQPQKLKKSLISLKLVNVSKFEAVKGVSFAVEKGDIVGIVGKNGSGKSTLLRAIANIFSPDSGTIDTCGNSVSLMAIGVGFINELSGRENIYLSGLLLGFTEEQINSKIEEIIDFSELGAFIDSPVRTYSSGMYSKLAFSITAILETDIMLIDEVLSVGDANFRIKSLAKLKELISDESRTVLIVSHNSANIRELCTRVIWIHQGKIKMDGDTGTVMDAYDNFMKQNEDKKKAQKLAQEKAEKEALGRFDKSDKNSK